MIKKALSVTVTILLLGTLLTSGFLLEKKLNGYRLEKQHKTETSMEVRKGRDVDFDALKERNADVRAWIYLPGSEIDYPVVQAEDNDYYLHRDFDRNYLYDGSIFIESANEDPFHELNTVIYGHHMFSGSMFCGLDNYSDGKYFRKNDRIQLTTEEGEYDIQVIAYCNEPSDSDLYYTRFEGDEPEDETDTGFTGMTAAQYVDLIKEKAINLSEEPFDEHDTFVTLSTCAYNYDEARIQVIGVLREPGLEEKTTEIITDNPLANRWLLLQIAVGLLMFLLVAVPVIRMARNASKH